MAFETFSLADVMSNAEQIKSARRQSKLDDLREIAMTQQIEQQGQQARQHQVQFDEKTRLDNTQWLANAGRKVLSIADPQQQMAAIQTAGNEAKRRGIIPQATDLSKISIEGIARLTQDAELMLEGINQPLSAEGKLVADVRAGLITPEQAAAAKGSGDPNEIRTLRALQSDPELLALHKSLAAAGASNAPANVQEWSFYSRLPADKQRAYLEMKRSSMVVREVGGVPTVINPNTQGTQLQPLSTLPQEAAAAATVAGAEAGAKTTAQAEAERIATAPKRAEKARSLLRTIDSTMEEVDKSLNNVNWSTSGLIGSIATAVKGSPAYNLGQTLLTVKSNLGFDRLQEMRDNSPTGGALGQVALEELRQLQSTVASLDQAQSGAQLKANLQKVQRHYGAWKDAVTRAQANEQPASRAQSGATGRWTIEEVP